MASEQGRGGSAQGHRPRIRRAALFLSAAMLCSTALTPLPAVAYSFSQVRIEGNERVEPATILSYAGIGRGQEVSDAGLNDAYQRIVASGLFESVEMVPSGGTLVIKVREYPTINVIDFEGNKLLKDDALAGVIKSQSRRVFSPDQAEADAAALTKLYADGGRLAAQVTPKIIRRDGNRVDLVFEIREGKVSEVERISFAGNRAFSDRRLREVLTTKQAGFLHAILRSDTFVADRVDFDKQVLTDFYHSRGYIDFEVLGVASEFSRERDAFFLTYNVREGQQFRIGNVSTVSDIPEANADEFAQAVKLRPGVVYSPTIVDYSVSRMEQLALQKGLDFIRIEPKITRNERDQTVDVQYVISHGPRVFVERIDIEGNATTLDKVIRRQFKTVEGDPFNPREIRNAAERIRALGFFSDAQVNSKPGSSPDQVIVDVNVTEQPTGSLSFGVSYGVSAGVGFAISFSEQNFLGRGQYLSASINTTDSSTGSAVTFIEPSFLDRDLRFRLDAYYSTFDNDNADYSMHLASIGPSIDFPVSEFGRLSLGFKITSNELYDVDEERSSQILLDEEGRLTGVALTWGYSYDTRGKGLNPNAGVVLSFNQELYGLGGDVDAIKTSVRAAAETKTRNEDVTFRVDLTGGMLNMLNGNSRVTDRFFGGDMRGFEPRGYGPRDLNARNEDPLGGNLFAVARFESQFPVGVPPEYGITGGVFWDMGSVWSLDNVRGGLDSGCTAPSGNCDVDDSFSLRSAVGFSIFWTTPIGPLRFNFSKAIAKEDYDKEQNFDLTVSTRF